MTPKKSPTLKEICVGAFGKRDIKYPTISLLLLLNVSQNKKNKKSFTKLLTGIYHSSKI
jgi:hypothetical protein